MTVKRLVIGLRIAPVSGGFLPFLFGSGFALSQRRNRILELHRVGKSAWTHRQSSDRNLCFQFNSGRISQAGKSVVQSQQMWIRKVWKYVILFGGVFALSVYVSVQKHNHTQNPQTNPPAQPTKSSPKYRITTKPNRTQISPTGARQVGMAS